MSTYVISDIHGCFDEFQKMLEKVEFGDDDNLIIAGDIVDRGPQSYEMLRYLEDHPENVSFTLGNHDDEFAYYCRVFANCMKEKESREKIMEYVNRRYVSLVNLDRYGTLKELIRDHECDSEDFQKWSDLIKEIPYYKELTINDKDFIVVHAGYLDPKNKNTKKILRKYNYSDIQTYNIWARDDVLEIDGVMDKTVVFGHTPTIASTSYYTGGTVFVKDMEKTNTRYINIDCGYVYKERFPAANMAMIRLEDEEVFYLETPEEE